MSNRNVISSRFPIGVPTRYKPGLSKPWKNNKFYITKEEGVKGQEKRGKRKVELRVLKIQEGLNGWIVGWNRR